MAGVLVGWPAYGHGSCVWGWRTSSEHVYIGWLKISGGDRGASRRARLTKQKHAWRMEQSAFGGGRWLSRICEYLLRMLEGGIRGQPAGWAGLRWQPGRVELDWFLAPMLTSCQPKPVCEAGPGPILNIVDPYLFSGIQEAGPHPPDRGDIFFCAPRAPAWCKKT